MSKLAEAIQSVCLKIQKLGSKPINEENTRASLIDPVLRALGWDTEDLEDVQREYKAKSRDKPVDYALMSLRSVRLFIEAKALGGDLDDRRWANQIMGYATVAGVEWIALTNGAEWRLYNAHAPVAVEEKLFRRVHLDDGQAAVETLELLAKNRLEDNRIEVLWRAHFVDRQVRAAIESLFDPENNDMLLVNYVGKRTRNLTAGEIRGSIARCRVALDFPADASTLVSGKRRTSKGAARHGVEPRRPVQSGVSLSDLIGAGLLRTPVEVRRSYRDKELTATILPNGVVRVKGAEFSSLSTAAVEAIRAATGIERSINGWDFWLIKDGAAEVPLATIRSRFQASGVPSPASRAKA